MQTGNAHSMFIFGALIVLALSGCDAGSEAPGAPGPQGPQETPTEAAAMAAVTGTAFYRERMAVPPGTRFEAVLLDVSRQDVAAKELARTVIEEAGQPPYAFTLRYDPGQIDPRMSYAVRAELRHEDRLLYATDTVYPVITRNAGNRVEVLLRRVPAG